MAPAAADLAAAFTPEYAAHRFELRQSFQFRHTGYIVCTGGWQHSGLLTYGDQPTGIKVDHTSKTAKFRVEHRIKGHLGILIAKRFAAYP